MKHTRRGFLQQASLGIAGCAAAPLAGFTVHENREFKKAASSLPIGFAGYTFAKFDVEKSIAMMNRLGVKYLSIKDFHLPLNSNQQKIDEVKAKFAAAGITIYAVGVIYMKKKEEVDTTFDYAKRTGVDLIVGVPNYDLLDYTEQKVKETGIRMAIHNHGPEDALYPGPKDVYDRIKDRDKRMGLCIDIGHAVRAGADPAAAIKAYKDRLFDMHIKDVSEAVKDGKAMEVGRGVIDFTAVVKALKKINFQGMSSLEFEKDMTDPMAGMAESLGFFRGVISAT